MNQTPQLASVLVPILATCGLLGMLTVFGLASRTPTPPARPAARPSAYRVDVIESVDSIEPAGAQGAGGALVKQRGVSTPVA
jgi:hypothetical protein